MMLSLVAGLLNAVNAYAVYLLTPQPTFGGATFARTTTDISFTAASFLAGFIIVAAVFVIARVVSRGHQGEAAELGEESESDLNSEELSKLKSG